MKIKVSLSLLAAMLVASFLLGGSAFAGHYPPTIREIEPIVSTVWLIDNMGQENLVILDIRSEADYDAGHIPGSINEPFVVPFSAWITMRNDLLLEVPDDDDLFSAIGSLGITQDSWVVIVTAPNPGEPPFYGLANATRVALTLIYAGVANVAILDGGYPKWVEDVGNIETKPNSPTPVTYEGKVKKGMFVSANYVRGRLKRADIIDARDADVYFGVTIEFFAPKAGHIPNAVSLPTPWIWNCHPNQDGTCAYYTFKDPETLEAMASGVLREPWHYGGHGGHWGRKIIVYCGVGGYASSWWFVLTQVLGYQNVKFYDGSAQEWIMEGYDMVPYQWD